MDDNQGKKVFILYPPSVIQENMIRILVQSEFEVYLLYDYQKTARLMKKFSSPILYINIDKALSEEEWEEYVRFIMDDDRSKGAQIGIITYNDDKELAEKYLMDIGIQCGFVRLTLGLKASTEIILKTLLAVEARGQRRYVRAPCAHHKNVSFNLQLDSRILHGKILDISIAGMACIFDEEPPRQVAPGAVVGDLQLKLKGRLTKIRGKIAGKRRGEAGQDIYVILFDSKIGSYIKSKIHDFIRAVLQEEIETQLLSV